MTAAALPLSAAPDRYRLNYIIAITVSLAPLLDLLDSSIVNVAVRHGDGDLRRRRHGRPDPRAHRRRLDHGYLRLAVDLLHQYPLRDARPGADDVVHQRLVASAARRAGGLRRPGFAGCGDRRFADDARAR